MLEDMIARLRRAAGTDDTLYRATQDMTVPDPKGWAELDTRPATLTLQGERITVQTGSGLRHRALCECWECWAN